jgi:hypothetical protein
MLKDLYVQGEDEIGYQNAVIEVNSKLYNVIQKIRMILLTDKGDVLGDPDFGCSLFQYIFELNLSVSEVNQEISRQIERYINEDSREFDIKVSVNKNDDQQIAWADIFINNQLVTKFRIR